MVVVSYEDILLQMDPITGTSFVDASNIDCRGLCFSNTILLKTAPNQDFSGTVMYNSFPRIPNGLNIDVRYPQAKTISDVPMFDITGFDIYSFINTMEKLRKGSDLVFNLSSLNFADCFSIQYSHVINCDFSRSKFKNSTLQFCYFEEASFYGANIRDCCFIECTFADGVSFENTDVTRSKFINPYIAGEVDFTGSNVRDAVFTHEFDDSLNEKQKKEAVFLCNGAALSGRIVSDFLFREIDLRNSELKSCVFSNLKAHSRRYSDTPVHTYINFYMAAVQDCRFMRINCSDVDFRHTCFERCVFESVFFKSTRIQGAQFIDCIFENCEIFQDYDELESSIEAEFKDCTFYHSNVVGQR